MSRVTWSTATGRASPHPLNIRCIPFVLSSLSCLLCLVWSVSFCLLWTGQYYEVATRLDASLEGSLLPAIERMKVQ